MPVDIWIESVIQENSPASATTLSPGLREIDSTGSVVPRSCSSMVVLSVSAYSPPRAGPCPGTGPGAASHRHL